MADSVSELQAWSRPRPIRVAFLVQNGEHAQLMLDGIFADCHHRWGGRFSLVVPCVNGKIPDSYWPWLEAYDPDVVYSYLDMDDAELIQIHERLNPSEYRRHGARAREIKLDARWFRPAYDFAPLLSLSTAFRQARHFRFGEGSRLKLIDSWFSEEPSRFLMDNFGTYHSGRGSMLPSDASVAVGLLTIVSPSVQADPRRGVPKDLDAIPDELTAFRAFAERKATSMSVASLAFAPKLDMRVQNWSGSFNLVIGDSFADRMLFWNARLLLPSWLDTDLHCLRVSKEQLADLHTREVVGELLRRRNHANEGSGGQPQLVLRSTSLSQEELAEADALLRTTKHWSMSRIEVVADLDAFVPDEQALNLARESSRYADSVARSDWAASVWKPPTLRPRTTSPDHLLEVPPRQIFGEGFWATDYAIEQEGPGPRFSERNSWALTRRWRMTGAFGVQRRADAPHSRPPIARGNRNGNLTLFESINDPVEAITVPTVSEAIRHALVIDGSWIGPNRRGFEEGATNKVAWMAPSNEARYLMGVLGLTDGLSKATQFLLHPYLRDMFAQLGGAPDVALDKLEPTINRLRKRARFEKPFDLHDDAERRTLAGLIVGASRSLKTPLSYVRYEQLMSDWKKYLEAFWEAHPQQRGNDSDPAARHEEESLDRCVIEMRRLKMIFQGYPWLCGKCHHSNWADLSALSAELTCDVCNAETPAPVATNWRFRPSEFLIESLRDHSVLSLIWTLSELRSRSKSAFLFDGPSWFGFSRDSDAPNAEADLLMLLDGKAVLCEVKSSWRSLRKSHIDDLGALAKRLRPDRTILAIMEDGEQFGEELAALKTELAAERIRFELLTKHDGADAHTPYLW
jgi:hypothetical protein